MKKLSKKQFKEQKGITLIMVLLILAMISATSLTLSIIIVNELMASKNTDEAITAYYAAEAGVEKGLYHFKTHQADPTDSFPGTRETLDNGAEIVSLSISRQGSFLADLNKNQMIQLNFYNPDNLDDDDAEVDMIRISGTMSGAGANKAKLEASYISWPKPSGELTWSGPDGKPNYHTSTEIYSPILEEDPNFSHDEIFSSGSLVYHIVRLKALYNDIYNLKIEAFRNGTPVPIPTGFKITSSGEYGLAKQAVTADIPWQKSVSGLFNYVIFTKEELEKK